MNKIGIICPYFGKLPFNYLLTFESMKNNNFIDWFIITDDCVKYNANNIFIINCEFKELKNKIYKKFNVKLNNPYKLCDFKITYGELFHELLVKYDYWGYCDLDIIFGDLKKIFTNDNLRNFDKIFDLGHISIYKNINDINISFKDMNCINKNWKKVLNSDYIWCVDERYPTNHKGICDILEFKNYRILPNNPKKCIDLRVEFYNFIPRNYKKSKYYYFTYDNGCLYINNYKYFLNDEIYYVHLQQKKNLKVIEPTSKYYITPKGFKISKPKNEDFFMKNIKFFWYIKFRINRKIKNIKRDKEIIN